MNKSGRTLRIVILKTLSGVCLLLALTCVIRACHACAGNQQQEATADGQEASGNPESRGEKIWNELCSRCHGDQGQGTEEYPSPLHGDLSVGLLADYISSSMPEDDPSLCEGDDAAAVAQYIYDRFYSPESNRDSPDSGVQFTRLTVRQFQESVADLTGGPTDPAALNAERGLRGVYFAARHWTDNRKLAEQTDPVLDFGEGVPHFDSAGAYPSLPKPEKPPENKMNEGFCVYWSGSLLAPRTGQYSIIVESKNGFQLWLNGADEPLIDRKVRSDDIERHVANIFLLGGRLYPLKLEFFSYPDPPARIRLLWVPPLGVEETIPATALLSGKSGESVAISTPFPPDDASEGYARGISISPEWDEAVTSAALEASRRVAERRWKLAGTSEEADDRIEKLKAWCYRFVESAFCRPLDETERQFFVDRHFATDRPSLEQVRHVVVAVLKSPRFLYPGLEPRAADFEIARSLALVLWDSVPDRQLFELAGQGKLGDPAAGDEQIRRMASDPRCANKLREFFVAWLQLDRFADMTRDVELYPGFDARLVHELRQSLERQIDSLLKSDSADYRHLFQQGEIPVNRRIAEFQGWIIPDSLEGESWFTVTSDPSTSAGILTHPYLMSGLAYHRNSSPIHRGVFIARNLLGRGLRPPQENFEPLAEDFDPSMNNRQRVEYQTRDATCMKCHVMINPLGFAMENYDAAGRFRKLENDRQIDAAAEYVTDDGTSIQLTGPTDIARHLISDEQAQKNFVRRLFRHFHGQPVEAFGTGELDRLHQHFVANEFNIRDLLIEISKVTFRL
jgi:Protein of unknown function (DUF1588)/Protein of unknown function (DUF1592)/PA14 domain